VYFDFDLADRLVDFGFVVAAIASGEGKALISSMIGSGSMLLLPSTLAALLPSLSEVALE